MRGGIEGGRMRSGIGGGERERKIERAGKTKQERLSEW